MNLRNQKNTGRAVWAIAAAAGMCAAGPAALAGSWVKVTANAPGSVNLMLLMSDGTVMAANNDGFTIHNGWYKLTPNALGNYGAGTWSTRASANDTRLYFASQVLQSGKVFVAGGEYGTGGPRAEIYDPVANTWTLALPPTTLLNPSAASGIISGNQTFLDACSEVLPSGSVMIMPVGGKTWGQPLLYNPTSNLWFSTGLLANGTPYQDEACWVKLPDGTIFTIDPFGTNTERYNYSTGTWAADTVVPVQMYDSATSELGAGTLLPNGKVFYLGASGNTAIYTPSGSVSTKGTWVAGPVIPNNLATPDAPAAMLTNGNVLCAVSPKSYVSGGNYVFPSPTYFYEYNPTSNTFIAEPSPTNATVGSSDNVPTYITQMLCLPDGSVLYSHMNTDVYRYIPSGTATAFAPTITSISENADGSFHLVGTGLNGISEGAAYGDDAQMATNYPLVRINHSNGNTYYARTYNWSSTRVQTGATSVTTEYALPAGFPAGAYTLVVVANQFPSAPTTAASVASDPVLVLSCPGGTAQFTVTGAGTPNLAYQWRKGTTNLTNAGHYSGVNTPTLTISPVSGEDAATNYNCLVSNVFGSAPSGNASLDFCAADFNCDGLVNDADFSIFVGAYDILSCSDPSMPPGCPADLNGDGLVTDLDFQIFVVAYDSTICQ